MASRQAVVETIAPIIEEMESRYPERVIAERCAWAIEKLDEFQPSPEDLEAAFDFVLNPEDKWVHSLTIAHLRIPRLEFIQWTDVSGPDEAMDIAAKLIVDKALTAFVVTTLPVHDTPGRIT